MTRALIAAAATAALLLAGGGPADAKVRFGKNVRIGGHDVSNQTFTAKRRGLFIIHRGKPAKPGCRWIGYADGSRTKVCHLQRKPR